MRIADVAATRSGRGRALAVVVALLAGVLAVVAAPVVAPADALTVTQAGAAPSGETCLANTLHPGTSFPACYGITLRQSVQVNDQDVVGGTQLQVGDVVQSSVFAPSFDALDSFYKETGDGLLTTEDWEARIRITLPSQTGILSAPRAVMSMYDRGDRGVGPTGNCAAQAGQEPSRSDDSLNVTLGAAPVGLTGEQAALSGNTVIGRWTDLAVDRCAGAVSTNGVYSGQYLSLYQTVLARPTSDQTLTWGLGGIALGRKALSTDSLTWGAATTMSLTIRGAASAPTALTATARNAAVQLSWTAPANDGGNQITGYRVTPFIGGVAQSVRTFATNDTAQTISGLSNGTTYTFKVAAVTAGGVGTASGSSGPVTPRGAPATPTGVTAVAGNGSATVTWTNPTDTGGGPLLAARVRTYRNGVFAGEVNPAAQPSSVVRTGLVNGDSYTFTVQVTNGATFSAVSTASAAVVPGRPPAPANLVVTPRGGGLDVAWQMLDDGGSAITGSTLRAYDLSGNVAATTTYADAIPNGTVSGLVDGTPYRLTVALRNVFGTGVESPRTAPVTAGLVPGAPTDVTATASTTDPDTLDIAWTDPVGTGSGAVLGSRTTVYQDGVVVTTRENNDAAPAVAVSGLTPGVNYTATVQLRNAAGWGPESAPSAAVTAVGRPGAPHVYLVDRPADGVVDLYYDRPTDTGGRPLTSFRITPYLDGVAQPATATGNGGYARVSALTVGATYTFTVAASNGLFVSEESPPTAPVVARKPVLPGAPTIGAATTDDDVVTVRWTPPASDGDDRLNGYVITPYLDGVAQPTEFAPGDATERGFQVLSGVTYRFTVAARNGVGLGAASAPSNPVTTSAPAGTPGAPTAVYARPGTGEVEVRWTAPADTGTTAVTSYAVRVYVGGIEQSVTVVAGTKTAAQISGLTNGTAHRFRVTARNDAGTGAVSAASVAVTPSDPPSAPARLSATAGVGTVTLVWSAPVTDGGNPITGYTVTPYINSREQPSIDVPGTARTRVVSGLIAGVNHQFVVAARNAVGDGPGSPPSAAVKPTAPGGAPGAPTLGTATPGDSSATVTWTAPGNPGTSPVTGYRITVFEDGSALPPVTRSGTATTTTITGLGNGTPYTFRVAAINDTGIGVATTPSAVVVPTAPAAAPIIGKATAGNGTVRVTWSPASAEEGVAPTTGYRITPFVGGVAQTPVTVTGGSIATRTLVGLTNGTAYRFAVAAVNTAGPGPNSKQSNTVTPTAPPGTAAAPTIGTAEAFNTTALVRWSAPAANGTGAITGYLVTPYVADVAGTPTTFSSTATTQVVTGLTNGTGYRFRVAAINAGGTGAYSTASNAVTPNPAPGTPSAPTVTTVTAGSGSVTVSWNPPTAAGSAPITAYRITPFVGSTAQPQFQFNDTLTTHTITGLTNGATYRFSVAAVNAAGPGADSARSAAVTPG